MISKRYIVEWFESAPWANPSQIEQDLIISRALVNIFENTLLRKNLVFRGGTALNKLFFRSSLRYSEDIDLVQFKAGPFGNLMTQMHQVLDPWLGKLRRYQMIGQNYRKVKAKSLYYAAIFF